MYDALDFFRYIVNQRLVISIFNQWIALPRLSYRNGCWISCRMCVTNSIIISCQSDHPCAGIKECSSSLNMVKAQFWTWSSCLMWLLCWSLTPLFSHVQVYELTCDRGPSPTLSLLARRRSTYMYEMFRVCAFPWFCVQLDTPTMGFHFRGHLIPIIPGGTGSESSGSWAMLLSCCLGAQECILLENTKDVSIQSIKYLMNSDSVPSTCFLYLLLMD